jgi:hypothetical protein
MPSLIDSEEFSRFLVGAAAHEVGHVFHAFSLGKQVAQVDFQMKQIAEAAGIEGRARTYRTEFDTPAQTAASGFAGSIAQALILTPDATPNEIYAEATDPVKISKSDLRSIEALPEPDRRPVFEQTLERMRALLPYITEQTNQLTARVREVLDTGEESIGFLYRNPDPIPTQVPIRQNLF